MTIVSQLLCQDCSMDLNPYHAHSTLTLPPPTISLRIPSHLRAFALRSAICWLWAEHAPIRTILGCHSGRSALGALAARISHHACIRKLDLSDGETRASCAIHEPIQESLPLFRRALNDTGDAVCQLCEQGLQAGALKRHAVGLRAALVEGRH